MFLTGLLAVKQRNLKAKFENFNCNIIFNLCNFKLFNHVSFVKKIEILNLTKKKNRNSQLGASFFIFTLFYFFGGGGSKMNT